MRLTDRIFCIAALSAATIFAGDAEKLLRVDHFIGVKSAVPAMAGQTAEIYVREVVGAGTALRGRSFENKIVLFVHGAGTPAEVAFDVPYQDYSWMAYLANAGFDVFSMDMTGYGRSTRPSPMNNPCNLAEAQQKLFVPALLSAPCKADYTQQMTTIESDWTDVGAVVDHVLALRHVQKLSLVAWSLGGPRAGGYTSQHPDRISRLVLLAPAYNRQAKGDKPAELPARGVAMNTQSHEEFTANWDRQVGCPNQYDQAASDAVWSAMLESDPVGATWGTGARRAPLVTTWGWTTAVVAKMNVPLLAVSGAHDKQVAPDRVRELYADIGSKEKVFADLACSSHNAAWEKNHSLLFEASIEWLTKGTVKGTPQGMIKLGY